VDLSGPGAHPAGSLGWINCKNNSRSKHGSMRYKGS
jgi:hypothetical protein